jgi:hypothetical protein
MRMKTVEQKVAETILDKRESVEIGGVTYEVAPPSLGTLILVSELISTLPPIRKGIKDNDIITEALSYARNGRVIAEIAATLIIGAKEIRTPEIKSSFGRVIKKSGKQLKEELTERLLLEASPEKIGEVIVGTINRSGVGFFLTTSIFLNEANLTKPTKTTASGA